jgi:hypothetical protein
VSQPDSHSHSNSNSNSNSDNTPLEQHTVSTPRPYNFDFPTLEDDGSVSVSDLTTTPRSRRQFTPPAALTARGQQAMAMADYGNVSESEGSLADQYDMIDHDDLSEISNDDHDTASITSNDVEHDGQLTPELDESDGEGEHEPEEHTQHPTHSPIDTALHAPSSESVVMVDLSASQAARQVKAENELLDSYMSDDLDTPCQSTTIPFERTATRLLESKLSFQVNQNPSHTPFVSNRQLEQTATHDDNHVKAKTRMARLSPTSNIAKMLITALMLLCCSVMFSAPRQVFNIPARREALAATLYEVAGLQNVTSIVDMEHLLPSIPAACYGKTWYRGQYLLPTAECRVEPRFQALQPNHMLLSLPSTSAYPRILSTKLFKADGRNISFSATPLIEGVSVITFDANEAYDTVVLSTIIEKPVNNFTASHYYGKRFLQRKTYAKAGSEVSKIVGSDLAIVSKTVQKINHLLSTEVTASVQATRNVTTQLARYVGRELQVVSRELQVIGKTANALLSKAGRANEELAKSVVQDLVVVQKDLVKFTKELSGSVKSTVQTAKSSTTALIRERLILGRQRALKIQQIIRDKRAAKPPKAQQTVPRQSQGKTEQQAKLQRQKLALERRNDMLHEAMPAALAADQRR